MTAEDKYQRFHSLAEEIGNLLEKKNRAYGDSFFRSGKVLEELFPNGIRVDQYDDLLYIVRVLDKIFRIATDPYSLNEDAYKDTAGYSILAAVRREIKQKDKNKSDNRKRK